MIALNGGDFDCEPKVKAPKLEIVDEDRDIDMNICLPCKKEDGWLHDATTKGPMTRKNFVAQIAPKGKDPEEEKFEENLQKITRQLRDELNRVRMMVDYEAKTGKVLEAMLEDNSAAQLVMQKKFSRTLTTGDVVRNYHQMLDCNRASRTLALFPSCSIAR